MLKRIGIIAALMLWAGAATAQQPTVLVSYETTPFDLLGLDGTGIGYDARAALTTEALDDVVPQILTAIDVAPDDVTSMVMPGGYQLATNASLQSWFDGDPQRVDQFAAALGFVFRQWSVLVTDFTPTGPGNAAYAVIEFPQTLSADQAQAFFLHAASVDQGLGGGYTAFDDEMFFLNLGDSTGAPYSGLDDQAFVDQLQRAADTFDGEARLASSGRVDARFVENDWQAQPEGQGYLNDFSADQVALLILLRQGNDARMQQAARQPVQAPVPVE